MTRLPTVTGKAQAEIDVAAGERLALEAVPSATRPLLVRMFADPSLLDADERTTLVAQLEQLVHRHPGVADIRVLLGMALCVNLEPQAALEQLGAAVEIDPHSFIAHLKLGELWMRLRVPDRAEHHTHRAARLARNPAQSQLARSQAATLRTMVRDGIIRGGSSGSSALLGWLRHLRVRFRGRNKTVAVMDAR